MSPFLVLACPGWVIVCLFFDPAINDGAKNFPADKPSARYFLEF